MTIQDAPLTQLRRGVLEPCVLALVEHEPRYAYDLAAELAAGGIVAGQGSVYPLLSRMLRDGLVSTAWRESKTGPPRKYYSPTRSGLDALAAFRESWSTFQSAVTSITAPQEVRA